jgi:8-oxo-dGTP diphosphatase
MELTPPIQVVAAVIEREGRFLVGKRPAHKRHGGLWEFPGGKLQQGEDFLAAARRELAEELGVEVKSVGPVDMSIEDAASLFVISFARTDIVGEPMACEHDALAWVASADLLRYELAPSDRLFATSVLVAGTRPQ